MDTRAERVVLILADVSGYTRFMLVNQTALVHAQMVITKLLEEIIREVEIPLQVKEVEGDAVFLYAVKPDDDAAWEETRRLIGATLVSFFEAFARGILAGSEFALCSCPSDAARHRSGAALDPVRRGSPGLSCAEPKHALREEAKRVDELTPISVVEPRPTPSLRAPRSHSAVFGRGHSPFRSGLVTSGTSPRQPLIGANACPCD